MQHQHTPAHTPGWLQEAPGSWTKACGWGCWFPWQQSSGATTLQPVLAHGDATGAHGDVTATSVVADDVTGVGGRWGSVVAARGCIAADAGAAHVHEGLHRQRGVLCSVGKSSAPPRRKSSSLCRRHPHRRKVLIHPAGKFSPSSGLLRQF